MSDHQVISGRIGIVVIGRNEGARLIKCLYSVLKAKVPVVYVDSQSSDNSVAEAEELNITTVILNLTKPLSAARARNEGFGKLIQDYPDIQYVHFIDADCELADNWLSSAVSALDKQEKVAVVCGRLHEKYRNKSIYMRLCDMDWYRKPGLIDACGGIATYRRGVFDQLGGFNATLIAGEEPEFCMRIRKNGWNILCLAEAMGTHDSSMVHFSQWWRRCVKVGFGYKSGIEWNGWAKQYKSTIVWGGFMPTAILLNLLWSNYSLLILMLYPIQVIRIFLKNKNLSVYDNFIYSLFCVLAKFPQMQGVLKFYLNRIIKRKQVIIEYKI